VITLIEPRLLDRAGFLQAPYYVRMVEAADVLVANRCDLATPGQLARLDEWAAGLYPPKLHVLKTVRGEIPDEVFELHGASSHAPTTGARRPAHTDDHCAGGCTFPAELVFDTDLVEHLLQQLAIEGVVGNEVLRLKAILHTQDGWKLYEIARGQSYCRPTDYRRDSRVDWITVGIPILDEVVRGMLARCVLDAK
jgi:G3E family GTPase